MALLLLCACDAASTAVVDNGFADTFTVYRAWWQATYFPTPVDPGMSSEPLRTVAGTGNAWAVLAREWDGGTPTGFTAVRSNDKLTLENRGDVLDITVGADSFSGICGVNGALSNEDGATAALLFPDELSGTYDQSTCSYLTTP